MHTYNHNFNGVLPNRKQYVGELVNVDSLKVSLSP